MIIKRIWGYICFGIVGICIGLLFTTMADIRYGTTLPLFALISGIIFGTLGAVSFKLQNALWASFYTLFLGLYIVFESSRENSKLSDFISVIGAFLFLGTIIIAFRIIMEIKRRRSQTEKIVQRKDVIVIGIAVALYSWVTYFRAAINWEIGSGYIVTSLCAIAFLLCIDRDNLGWKKDIVVIAGMFLVLILICMCAPLVNWSGIAATIIIAICMMVQYVYMYQRFKRNETIKSGGKIVRIVSLFLLGLVCSAACVYYLLYPIEGVDGFYWHYLIATIGIVFSVVAVLGNVTHHLIYFSIVWFCLLELLVLDLAGYIYYWTGIGTRWLYIIALMGLGGYIVRGCSLKPE